MIIYYNGKTYGIVYPSVSLLMYSLDRFMSALGATSYWIVPGTIDEN